MSDMVITVVGSIHQKYPLEGIQSLLDVIVGRSIGHRVIVDQVFYHYLRKVGVYLPPGLAAPVRDRVETDFLVSIGGDGTFLRSAKLIAGTGAVMIGVNTGRLGFLASNAPDELLALWEDYLAGRYNIDIRTMIEARTTDSAGTETSCGTALNEVAVLKRDTASMISVDTEVNRSFLASYEADGLLISTPTGSTAYALSAHGPIVSPECPVLEICPVAPHSLNMRPILIPDSAEIRMTVRTRSDKYLLSLDGRSSSHVVSDIITVALSPKRIRIAQHPTHSFTETLRKKLLWGQKSRIEDEPLT